MSETNQPSAPKTGSFSWNELVTSDSKASGNFYSQLFGWEIITFPNPSAPPGTPPYLLFKTAANPMGVGGMMQTPHPTMPTHWTPYVVVDNADVSLAKAVELGAQVCVPVMPIPNVGRIACIIDPQGAVLGFHELPKPA
jgi:predicted enzyme related to lactoylglutathione lyase